MVAQRWNPLWVLTVTLGGTHTNLPAAPGNAPWASGVGILTGQEPCVSGACELGVPGTLGARGEGAREQREKDVLWLPGLLPLGAFRCSEPGWPFHLMAQPGLVPPGPSRVSLSLEVVLVEAREESYSQRLREGIDSFVCVPPAHPVAQSSAECPQAWHRTRRARPGAGRVAVMAAALQRPRPPVWHGPVTAPVWQRVAPFCTALSQQPVDVA